MFSHILFLVLHRYKETEQPHSFHHPAMAACHPRGSSAVLQEAQQPLSSSACQQAGWTAHLCLATRSEALGEPIFRSVLGVGNCISKKKQTQKSQNQNQCQLWSGATGASKSSKHLGANYCYLLVGCAATQYLDYSNLLFTYTDLFFTTADNVGQNQDSF